MLSTSISLSLFSQALFARSSSALGAIGATWKKMNGEMLNNFEIIF